MRFYNRLWTVLTAVLIFEYIALNRDLNWSLLHYLKTQVPGFHNLALSTVAGRPLSFVMGWAGVSLMLLTNPYILRKKWYVLRGVGSLSGWLNFHIFCGIMGPVCIVFHSNFQTRGLAGLSFWSMIIVVISGVIGRYVYLQIALQEASSARQTKIFLEDFERLMHEDGGTVAGEKAAMARISRLKQNARRFVGLPRLIPKSKRSLLRVLWLSFCGDIRILLRFRLRAPGLNEPQREALMNYAMAYRHTQLMVPFRELFGYWHAFHMPFALFMYVSATVHIVSALIFHVAR